ncbi:MAG: GDSL-type esterase/lipase family protein [Planctomycetota bacterium]
MRARSWVVATLAASVVLNLGAGGFALKALHDRGGLSYLERRLGLSDAPSAVPQTSQVETLGLMPDVDGEYIFVGDSLTEAFRWSECFPGSLVQNHGIGGNRVADVAARLDDVIARRPAGLLVAIGTNDVGDLREPGTIADDIAEVLDRVAAGSSETRVVLKAVPPRRGAGLSSRIAELNGLLRDVAAARAVEFVDIYSPMVGKDGQIRPAMTTDGVHLTADAYRVWVTETARTLDDVPGFASASLAGGDEMTRVSTVAGPADGG